MKEPSSATDIAVVDSSKNARKRKKYTHEKVSTRSKKDDKLSLKKFETETYDNIGCEIYLYSYSFAVDETFILHIAFDRKLKTLDAALLYVHDGSSNIPNTTYLFRNFV